MAGLLNSSSTTGGTSILPPGVTVAGQQQVTAGAPASTNVAGATPAVYGMSNAGQQTVNGAVNGGGFVTGGSGTGGAGSPGPGDGGGANSNLALPSALPSGAPTPAPTPASANTSIGTSTNAQNTNALAPTPATASGNPLAVADQNLAPIAGASAVEPATASGYSAAQDVVAPNQTVANQFLSNTDPNSVLMQEAQTQGNEQSNSRGLLNSSLGISSAQNAMYQAALPISEQDASTQAQASLANQNATNTASQFTANAGNAASLANLSSQTQSMLQGMQDSTTAATAQLSSDTQVALGNLSSATQTQVQSMVNTNQQLLQTSTSAANTFNNAMNNIATIQNSTTLDNDAKTVAVNSDLTELQNFMAAQSATAASGGAGALPDLSQYFPGLPTATVASATTNSNAMPT